MRMDRAYACGISGGNGWQRLFEGTRLQYAFDRKPEQRYEGVPADYSGDEENCRTSTDGHGNMRRETDLESAWVEDLGVSWKVKEPPAP